MTSTQRRYTCRCFSLFSNIPKVQSDIRYLFLRGSTNRTDFYRFSGKPGPLFASQNRRNPGLPRRLTGARWLEPPPSAQTCGGSLWGSFLDQLRRTPIKKGSIKRSLLYPPTHYGHKFCFCTPGTLQPAPTPTTASCSVDLMLINPSLLYN